MGKITENISRTPSPTASPYERPLSASPPRTAAVSRVPSPVSDILIPALASTGIKNTPRSSQTTLPEPAASGSRMRQGPKLKKVLSPEKEALRAATKAKNAESAAKIAEARKAQNALETSKSMPGQQRAVIQPGLMSGYFLNMNHYSRNKNGEIDNTRSHGHDKAVRFSQLGYSVVQAGETAPSSAVKDSMELLTSQIKELIAKTPAQLVYTKEKHDVKMAAFAASGEPTYSFPGEIYNVDGNVTTPSGSRAVLKTGWKITKPTGPDGPEVPVLLSAYFK